MVETILTNLIEDFLKGKVSTMIFVKYYRDIFGFSADEEEMGNRFKYLKDLHECLEHYSFISEGIDDDYYLDDNDVKLETSKTYRLINN